MLSVALFSSVENIKKLLFTASFGRVLNYLSLGSSQSYFSSPIPLSLGSSCPSCGSSATGAPRLCLGRASPSPSALGKGQPVSLALTVPSLVTG